MLEGSKQVSTKRVEDFYEFRRQVKTDEKEEERRMEARVTKDKRVREVKKTHEKAKTKFEYAFKQNQEL